jgi:hypothetical protein
MNNTRTSSMQVYNQCVEPGKYAVQVSIQGPVPDEDMWIRTTSFENAPVVLTVNPTVNKHLRETHARLARLGITRSTTITGRIDFEGANRGNRHPWISRRDVQYRLVIDFGVDGRFLSMGFRNRLLSDIPLLESARRKLLARIAPVSVIAQYIQWILGPV